MTIILSVEKQIIRWENPGRYPVAGTRGEVFVDINTDDEWQGRAITVLLSNSLLHSNPVAILWTGAPIVVPDTVLVPGMLMVSMCGAAKGGESLLPTARMTRGILVLQNGGMIGDMPEEVEPAIWEQVLAAVGNLDELETTEKSNLVLAINEVLRESGGGQGGGADAREIELRVYGGHIQWHYVGEASWYNLIALEALKGDTGTSVTVSSVTESEEDGGENIIRFSDGTSMSVRNGKSAVANTSALVGTAKKVKAYQRPDSLTLALMSDTHYANTDVNASEKLSTARLMAGASTIYSLDIVGNLGDLIPGNESLDTAKNDLIAIVGETASNPSNQIALGRGNHDDNGWYSYGGFGGSYKEDEMLNAIGQYQYIDSMNHGIVRDTNKMDGGYGYYDHEASKIRVFLLNTSDIPYVLKPDGSYRYSSFDCIAFSNEQINFVANALNFSDKEDPDSWAALFIMHVPMDTTNADGFRFGIRDALIRGVTQMLSVITAYKNGGRYFFSGSVYNPSTGDAAEDFMVVVNADYTEKGPGEVIGFISGHTNADNYSNQVGIERSLSRGYSYLSLVGSTSFANFIVNRSTNSISVVKHGASVPDLTEGATVVPPAHGTIEGGEWTIYYEQFRPTVANLFAGWDSAGPGFTFDPDNVNLDLETFELMVHIENANYICSKAVPITPLASYRIPGDYVGNVIAFNAAGQRSGYITPVSQGDYKTVTSTLSTQYYMVFVAHMPTYKDYENITVELIV